MYNKNPEEKREEPKKESQSEKKQPKDRVYNKGVLPKTGIRSNVIVLIGLCILVIISVIKYKKMRKLYKDEEDDN